MKLMKGSVKSTLIKGWLMDSHLIYHRLFRLVEGVGLDAFPLFSFVSILYEYVSWREDNQHCVHSATVMVRIY
jgi:hypothetical protein